MPALPRRGEEKSTFHHPNAWLHMFFLMNIFFTCYIYCISNELYTIQKGERISQNYKSTEIKCLGYGAASNLVFYL